MVEVIGAGKRKLTFPGDEEEERLPKACRSSREYFEDVTKRVSWNSALWVQYARFEESSNEPTRARAVWERALKAIPDSSLLWLKYAEFEIRHGFMDLARAVFRRAVDMVPESDQLWLAYVSMEEENAGVNNIADIFETWLDKCQYRPESLAAYAQFEMRRTGIIDKAREIFERFVLHPSFYMGGWIRYAEFEIQYGDVSTVRECFDRALYHDDLNRKCKDLFLLYKEFEILHGTLDWKRQRSLQYEQVLENNPLDYDSWLRYTQLVEGLGDNQQTRLLYRRAVANAPPSPDKLLWKHYTYLWISYACFEEIKAQDFDQAREVYRECLTVIPHEKFTFAKCWLLAAKFEIRQLKLNEARYILDSAIAKAPKDKIFNEYIALECSLGETDRCRKLYAKCLEWAPENCCVWLDFVMMESSLGETERARAIFELAIAQPGVVTPENFWDPYISTEECQGNFEGARELYERVLEKEKQHVRVWITYARFEARLGESAVTHLEDDSASEKSLRLQRARRVLRAGLRHFRAFAPEFKKERKQLLKEWRTIERRFGEFGDIKVVGIC